MQHRALDLAIHSAEAVGVRRMRQVYVTGAMRAGRKGFHGVTNSTKEDAPIGEDGDILRKSKDFEAFRLVLSLHSSVQHLPAYARAASFGVASKEVAVIRHSRTAIALACALLAFPALARAQSSPDFLFGSPNGMIGVRTGWLFSSANSDLFTFVQRHLTVDRKDFNAPAIGVDVEMAINPRLSAIGGFDFSQASKDSEYRDFVDNQRLPITQTTTLSELNLSGSIKVAITPRGREVSSRAFIPAAVTPYVGAGGGMMRYKFVQYGDFIDVDSINADIFTDTFRSDGWTPSAHVFGGVDVRVYKRLYLSGEGRYLWSSGSPDRDFIDFSPIDLAGFKVTAGVHYMF
jgi:hypothetical protein